MCVYAPRSHVTLPHKPRPPYTPGHRRAPGRCLRSRHGPGAASARGSHSAPCGGPDARPHCGAARPRPRGAAVKCTLTPTAPSPPPPTHTHIPPPISLIPYFPVPSRAPNVCTEGRRGGQGVVGQGGRAGGGGPARARRAPRTVPARRPGPSRPDSPYGRQVGGGGAAHSHRHRHGARKRARRSAAAAAA